MPEVHATIPTSVPAPSVPLPSSAGRFAAAGAIALGALLLETAVENVWRGSPLRWWTLIAVAVWVLAIVGGRRVIGWRGRLTGAAIFLLVLIVTAAFRVGSDADPGFYVAGLPLGRVVALVAAAGVALSCAALLRLPGVRQRWWLAAAGALLGFYGLLPIAVALVRGIPISRTVLGQWFWTLPPFWLQGAYLAAELLIPVALVVSVVPLARALVNRRPTARFAASTALALLTAFVVLSVELSRAGVPHLVRAAIDPLLAPAPPSAEAAARSMAAVPVGADAPPAVPAQTASDTEWLKPYRGMTLDQAFEEVATRVRYEPYAGVLRGARGTAMAAGGNAMDKSLLLAAILRANGHDVRFVRGRLGDRNLSVILRGLYPPRVPAIQLAADWSPYEPAVDSALLAIARDHVWLELNQGSNWLPLDPSFPRATIGEAYADAGRPFTELSDADFQRIDVRVKTDTAGTIEDLGGFDGKVAELALQPIALVISEIPVREAAPPKEKPEAQIGGQFDDSLGGGSPPPETRSGTPAERPLVDVRVTRELVVGTSSQALRPTISTARDHTTHLRREWLEFTLTGPGGLHRTFERVIQADGRLGQSTDIAARHRRLGIVILSGPVSQELVAQQVARVGAALKLDDVRHGVTEVQTKASAKDPAPALLAARELEAGVGIAASFLLPLEFAADSDAFTDQIAYPNKVAVVRGLPRILISTFETMRSEAGASTEMSLDLRLDDVQAYPYPGYPAGAARVFQTARGLQESVLEGQALERRAGQKAAVTTAALMREAATRRVELLAVTPATSSELGRAKGLPPPVRALIEDGLREGRHVVVPASAITIGNRERWGWWAIDPSSGAVTGVMDTGQNQAVTEYSLSTEAVGLNDEMGFYLGCIVGATTIKLFVVAKLLEYGEVTQEMIEEVKAFIENGSCNSMCPPKFEAGVFAEANMAGDCLKKSSVPSLEEPIGVGGGLKAPLQFCDRYNDGFRCAGGFILEGLTGKSPGSGIKIEVGFALPNCKEYKKSIGMGNQAGEKD